MPKFQCENEKCVKHTELDHELRVRFVWNPDTQKLESPYDECPVCGWNRKVVKDEGTGMPWFKSEDARNYNNKKVKKYDSDYRPSDDKAIKFTQENLRKASGQDKFRVTT
jgi:hypothetical protein